MNTRMRVWIGKDWAGGSRLYVCDDTGKTHPSGHGMLVKVATGFTWEEQCEGALMGATEGIPRADDLIQSVVDKAWEAGFRPRGFSDIKNETAALREHLKDMKTIAFHGLKIKRDLT